MASSDCAKACKDSDKKTTIIQDKESFLCSGDDGNKRCFCRFERIPSSGFKKCANDADCKPKNDNKVCKVELDAENMETTTVECGNGVCKCQNGGHDLFGSVRSLRI